MKRSNKKGFTIVELVIVIAVIAILASVLIPTIAGLVR
ncbi:MAG: prepilin-type N-terminal cleavage/methylation domain-containing protein, partial [Clostridia bacterium]|nr:prepilin-type N-terminal cleavage/methylation domain-containing protein [Clostridia bacterium]